MPKLDQNVEIHVRTTSDSSGLNKAEQDVKGFGGTLKSIGTIAAGIGLANVASQALDFGRSMVQAGMDTATFYENARIGFTTLLGSTEEANKVIAQIKKDALSTPFDAQALVDANKMLLSTGMSAGAARKDILNLGKAILATGGGNAELSRMSVNLQQISNVGKATAMDIKQFAFAGINIYQLLADATGKTVAETKDMEVSYELLSQALAKAGGEGGKFAEAFTNAGGSMQQVQSNMKEAIGTVTSEVLVQTGAFEAYKQTLLGVTTFVNTNKDGFIGFIISFVNSLKELWGFITAALKPSLDQLQQALNYMSQELNKAGINWGSTGGVMKTVGGIILNIIITVIKAAIEVITILAVVVGKLAPVFRAIGDMISWVVDRIKDLVNWVKDLINWLGNLGNKNVNVNVQGANKRAMGGFTEGLTLVGERGPELIQAPAGSYVHNNSDTRSMLRGTEPSKKIEVNQTNNIYNNLDMTKGLRDLGFALRSA